jgi:hypothetical protein
MNICVSRMSCFFRMFPIILRYSQKLLFNIYRSIQHLQVSSVFFFVRNSRFVFDTIYFSHTHTKNEP